MQSAECNTYQPGARRFAVLALCLVICIAPGRSLHAENNSHIQDDASPPPSASTGANQVTLLMAVAANFRHTLQELKQAFLQDASTAPRARIKISSGATGALYNQLINGAPFDIFFAADQKTPMLLANRGIGELATFFSYATGRMVLLSKKSTPPLTTSACSAQAPAAENHPALLVLLQASNRIVIANPRTAPYGAAGHDILLAMQSKGASNLTSKQVIGRNVAHAQQLFERSDADAALLSISQYKHMRAVNPDSATRFNYCFISADLHRELRQAAIQIKRNKTSTRPKWSRERDQVAQQFIDFMQSPEGMAIIERNGYSIPTAPAGSTSLLQQPIAQDLNRV